MDLDECCGKGCRGCETYQTRQEASKNGGYTSARDAAKNEPVPLRREAQSDRYLNGQTGNIYNR